MLVVSGAPDGGLAPRLRICPTSVAPGPVETPMTRGFNLGPTLPMGRIGRAEELAWPIAFLCTPAASYFSGAILDVNGGAFVG